MIESVVYNWLESCELSYGQGYLPDEVRDLLDYIYILHDRMLLTEKLSASEDGINGKK